MDGVVISVPDALQTGVYDNAGSAFQRSGRGSFAGDSSTADLTDSFTVTGPTQRR